MSKIYCLDHPLFRSIFKVDEKDNLIDFRNIFKSQTKPKIDEIYKATIVADMSNIQAYCVQLNENYQGFLPYKYARLNPSLNILGQAILVQIKQVGRGDKMPLVSGEISIPGHFIIYYPMIEYGQSKPQNQIKFSKEIPIDTCEKIKKKLQWMNTLDFGDKIILRSSCGRLSDMSPIKKEYLELISEWKRIQSSDVNNDLVLQGWGDGGNKIDYPHDIPISLNSKRWYKEIYRLGYTNLNMIEDTNIYKIAAIQDCLKCFYSEIKEMGVILNLDKCEMGWAIDVNYGKDNSSDNNHDSQTIIFKKNQLASEILAKHVVARNFSGIVVIDWISMNSQSHIVSVKNTMLNLLSSDKCKSNLSVNEDSIGILVRNRKGEEVPTINHLHKHDHWLCFYMIMQYNSLRVRHSIVKVIIHSQKYVNIMLKHQLNRYFSHCEVKITHEGKLVSWMNSENRVLQQI